MTRFRNSPRPLFARPTSRFRGSTLVDPTEDPPAAAPRAKRGDNRALLLVVVAIWGFGLLALGSVIAFQLRLDSTRQAQIVIGEMRSQQGALLSIAFAPAIVDSATPKAASGTTRSLKLGEEQFDSSVARLARLGHSQAPARIAILAQRYYRLVNRLAALVAANRSRSAALVLGVSERRGGADAALLAEFDRADASYGSDSARSKTVASLVTVGAILFLLTAFSIAFHHLMRARRRSQDAATTDALTGLGNRRKLFADMAQAVGQLGAKETITVGIFDLDGFKAYNDTFGHPAGDALLVRIGDRLARAIGARGNTYRIGGDEFVVYTDAVDHETIMADARAALTEDGASFSIDCSLGTASVHSGGSLEAALQLADQRLYTFKRSTYAKRRSEAKDALLQVLAEQDGDLVTHLGHVAALAANTASALELTHDEIELTRLAAELHDIGKAAIPDSILNKPGPLTTAERAFMERHSAIGERIVAAAPTLEAIAPIIRAVHERPDGAGYPDGLHGDQIPICSRVIAVVDAHDAMTTDRPYRDAISESEALAELQRHAGTQFDPDVVDAFIAAVTSRGVPDEADVAVQIEHAKIGARAAIRA